MRVSERGNPPLQGHYTLWDGPQPHAVTLFGLISQPGVAVRPLGGSPVILRISAYSAARIVAGTGGFTLMDATKSAVAYWNKRHIEPMPGNVLYLSVLPIPLARRREGDKCRHSSYPDAADTGIMKKHILTLSVLALGISAFVTYQPLLGHLHNLTLAAWACCKRRRRVWRVRE